MILCKKTSKLLTFVKKSIIVITSEYRTLPGNEMTHCVTEFFWLRKADNFLLTRGNRRGNTSEEAEFNLVFSFICIKAAALYSV